MTKEKYRDSFEKIFFAITFILSCFTMNSDRLNGYFKSGGNVIILTRYFLIIIFILIATLMNREKLNFLKRFVPCSTAVITAILIFDYYVTKISGSQFLYRVWWIGAVFITNAVVFLVITIFGKGDYKGFFKSFWIGFTPIYLFLLILCFARQPFAHIDSINLKIGQGTFLMLESFLNDINVSFEAPLIFFGNLLILIPIPFILSAFFNRINDKIIFAIGMIIPFIIEGYQYFFKCGDTDIDDIILNASGFIIGYAIYILIKKTRLLA